MMRRALRRRRLAAIATAAWIAGTAPGCRTSGAQPPPPAPVPSQALWACVNDPVNIAFLDRFRDMLRDAWQPPDSERGIVTVKLRFRLAPSGAILERSLVGEASAEVTESVLHAFDSLPRLDEVPLCLTEQDLVGTFVLTTEEGTP